MAYKLQEVRVVPAGLNLLAPGDQLPAGDCIDLSGWWSGAAGKLEQAKAWTMKATDVGVEGHTISEAQGHLYFGAGTGLWQYARGSVDTGYDGNPLGMVGYRGYAWIMNRSKQRKDNGTTCTNWAIETPGTVSLTPDSGGNLADGDHDYYVTFVDDSGSESNPSAKATETFTGGEIAIVSATGTGGQIVLDFGRLMGTYDPGDGSTVTVSGCANTDANGTWILRYLDTPYDHATLEGSVSSSSGLGGTMAFTRTTTTSTSTGKVTITRPTAVTPAVIVGWNVYHRSPASSIPYKVNQDYIPYATTTYVDYGNVENAQDDDSLAGRGEVMESDHNAPPACSVLADRTYNDRILAASSAAYPNRIWYTQPGQPSYFRGSGNPQVGDWVDVGNDPGDAILHLSVKPGMVVIYRQRSIWRHVGDFGDGEIEAVVPDMGVTGFRAVAPTSGADFFVGRSGESIGIYRLSDWPTKVSTKIEPVLLGKAAENYAAMNVSAYAKCALGYSSGRLWFSYPSGSNTVPTESFVWHMETDRWFSASGGWRAFYHGSASFYAVGRNGNGELDSMEDSFSAQTLQYQSAYETCGDPDHDKTWADLVLSHNTAGVALTVSVRLNKNANPTTDTFTLTTITSSALTREVIPLVYPSGYVTVAKRGLPIRSQSLAIRIGGTGAGSAAYVDSPILLHYYREARSGRSFDTGIINHGTQDVKTVDQVDIEIDTTDGAATLQIYSDIPGGMAARLGAGTTIAQGARRIVRLVFTPIDGRLLRYTVTSATSLQVYGFRARVLPIGVYVDGVESDLWKSEAMAIGA